MSKASDFPYIGKISLVDISGCYRRMHKLILKPFQWSGHHFLYKIDNIHFSIEPTIFEFTHSRIVCSSSTFASKTSSLSRCVCF